MPFTLPTPVVVDGVEYPYAGVSLITSPGFGESAVSARVSLTLEPYRIDSQGRIERPTKIVLVQDESGNAVEMRILDNSRNISKNYSNAYQDAATDPLLAQALFTISSGIQEFINLGVQNGN